MKNSEILKTIRKILKEQTNQDKNWINNFPCLYKLMKSYDFKRIEDVNLGTIYTVYVAPISFLYFKDGSMLTQLKDNREDSSVEFWFCYGNNDESVGKNYKPKNEMNVPTKSMALDYKTKEIQRTKNQTSSGTTQPTKQ